MKKQLLSPEFKVGLTVIISSLILIFGIIWGKEYRFTAHKYSLNVLFSEVGGMVVGDPVTVNGVKEGKISAISWKGRYVMCTLEVNDHIQLYEDAVFTVVSSELLAGMKVEIFPGNSPQRLNLALQPFSGEYGGRIVDVGLMIGKVAKDISRLSYRADSALFLIKQYVGSSDLRKNITESFYNLNKLSANFAQLSDSLGDVFKSVNRVSAGVHGIVEDNKDNIKLSVENLATLSTRLDSITYATNAVLAEVVKKRGALGKMVYDSTLYIKLNRTLTKIDSLADQIKNDGLELNLF
jgi:phospholipid/cholesterol/gamma-HCH transport system substrate-binding protein